MFRYVPTTPYPLIILTSWVSEHFLPLHSTLITTSLTILVSYKISPHTSFMYVVFSLYNSFLNIKDQVIGVGIELGFPCTTDKNTHLIIFKSPFVILCGMSRTVVLSVYVFTNIYMKKIFLKDKGKSFLYYVYFLTYFIFIVIYLTLINILVKFLTNFFCFI